MTNLKSTMAVLVLGATLASCGGGGGSSSGPSKSWKSSSYITADGFVAALNDVDDAYLDTSYVVKDQYETERGYGDWFVIYDAEYNRNLAVDIDYIRTLEYYDYYTSNYNAAEAFRDQQWDDSYYNGGILGDGFGDDYEEVVYSGSDIFEDYYIGLDSGSLYEDEAETYDVSQMAADVEKKSLLSKAADVSVAYEIDMVSSLELVSIAVKAQKMLSRAQDEHLLEEDAMALKNDIEKFTGASFDDFQKAQEDREFRESLLKKVSEKRKVSAEKLENKLLPELFNIQL